MLDRYGQISFEEFLRARHVSLDAMNFLRLIGFDFVGEGAGAISALELLGKRAILSSFKQPLYALQGGNDLLPRAFADRLSDKIHYGAVVKRIEHSSRDVRVVYQLGENSKTAIASHLICTIPFSVLRHLDISPPFSQEKMFTINELPYTTVARVYFQTRSKFWSKKGLPSTFAVTDLPFSYFWESTWSQNKSRGILAAFATGAHAQKVTIMEPSARLHFALDHTKKIYPQIVDNYEGGTSVCWKADPWALGGYSWFKPGPLIGQLPHIARPEGRVHFAGEHTASVLLHATMQGALESGIRAAREINNVL